MLQKLIFEVKKDINFYNYIGFVISRECRTQNV